MSIIIKSYSMKKDKVMYNAPMVKFLGLESEEWLCQSFNTNGIESGYDRTDEDEYVFE